MARRRETVARLCVTVHHDRTANATVAAGRIGAIPRAAYTKYIARIGREPSPMAADFAAQIVANRVVVDARRRGQSSLRALGAG